MVVSNERFQSLDNSLDVVWHVVDERVLDARQVRVVILDDVTIAEASNDRFLNFFPKIKPVDSSTT